MVFHYIFVNLLPDVVREVVSSMDSLDEMAKTANNILQANASSKIAAASVADPEPEVAALLGHLRPLDVGMCAACTSAMATTLSVATSPTVVRCAT